RMLRNLLLRSTFLLVALCDISCLANESGAMAFLPRYQIAFGVPAENALNMDQDQIRQIAELNANLKRDTTGLFQSARHKKISMPELFLSLDKLRSTADSELERILTKDQLLRLEEIFIQVNDAKALEDAAVIAHLGITEEQRHAIDRAREQNTRSLREAYPTFRNLTRQEQRAKFESLQHANRERVISILTEEQRVAFEAMKGESIEFDHAEFRIRRSRTNALTKPVAESPQSQSH
ncbi:MAG: hypothetical protein KDB27_33655, partial [Planctomycetales bacterium]|nr:hypothetical protein [Planctomycetales bacterium]